MDTPELGVIRPADAAWSPPLPEATGFEHLVVETPGLRTHLAAIGEGEPVVLPHGFPQHWWQWRAVAPAIAAAGCRVLCPDLRGAGWTVADDGVLKNAAGERLVGFLHVPRDAATDVAAPVTDQATRHAGTREVIGAALRGYVDEAHRAGTEPTRILLTGYGTWGGVLNNPTGDFGADPAWSLRHPVAYTLIWVVGIVAVCAPLAVNRFNASVRD